MAVTGSGTQADPWIVHNWSEFTEKKADGNNKYIRFTDINIDENGDFVIEGDGTSSNPFQVSTYNEMLYVTGAHFIYQCKLMESEDENNDAVAISPTEPRMYYYDDGESDIKYCLFDPRPSTINFNDISDGYISNFYITNHVDCNGWTWLNARVNMDDSSIPGIFTASNMLVASSKASVRNLILLNCQAKATRSTCYLFSMKMIYTIMQIEVDATGISSSQDSSGVNFANDSDTYGGRFEKVSLVLKIIGNCSLFNSGSGNGAFNIVDSIVDIDANCTYLGRKTSYVGATLYLLRSVLKGRINYTTQNNYSYILQIDDSVHDVEYNGTPSPPRSSGVNSVFNKDKVNWSDTTGLTGVTSAQLLSPTALQEAGLLIGVDT